jgi:hypothetical protein
MGALKGKVSQNEADCSILADFYHYLLGGL